jgi:DNA-binding PadR family transcriptional regulator
MAIGMSLLAILHERPTYGLRLKNEFEARTAGVWPLNVGQVYTTLGRLQRDGLVAVSGDEQPETQKFYEITDAGRARLNEWFEQPATAGAPSRDELVLKLVMAARHGQGTTASIIQTQRRGLIEVLQEYTRLKRDASSDAELGWLFLLDSLIFQTEACVRWLDACEARLSASRHSRATTDRNIEQTPMAHPEEVST